MPPHTMMDHNTKLERPGEGRSKVVHGGNNGNNNSNGSSSTGQGGQGQQDQASPTKVKCVLVGDGAVGKTSLIVSYTTNGFPTEYLPTAFDNYEVRITVDNTPVQLQLCDTAGQDDFDSLRPLCYPDSHVFLLCFSVVSPTSFHNLLEKWVPELRRHCPGAPLILVGTQSDLRGNIGVLKELAKYGDQPVTEETATKLAEQLGAQYVECSSLTQKNLKEVFDAGILASMNWAAGGGYYGKEEEGEEEAGVSSGFLGRSRSLLRKSTKRSRPSKDPVFFPPPQVAASQQPSSSSKGSSPRKAWKKLCCFM